MRWVGLLAASVVCFSGGPALAIDYSQALEFTFCNQDGASSVMIVFADQFPMKSVVEGRYEIAKNTCSAVWRVTNEYVTHNIYFIDPRYGTLLSFDFGATWRGREAYCVNPGAKNDLFESVLKTPGRTKTCIGDEQRVVAPLSINGQEGRKQQVVVPSFSNSNAPTDGKTCFLGFCI